ncbi:hypothetical protein PGB90_005493 [Kerria lacca]
MSTYCRITGKSRGLPKPNYFPLLPPISPADAKRLCRITGKSYGLPTHHYIPVLIGFSEKRKRTPCAVTTKAEGQEVHHYLSVGVKHLILKNFRYVFPILETNPDLLEMLEKKTLNNDHKYVYTVNERRCSLIFPSKLEAAVRDGDVRDIMLAKHSDTLLLKLRKGGSVELDVKDFCIDDIELFEGEGPNKELLNKRKKRTHHDKNEWRRKIFEDKEKQADNEEDRISEIKSKRIKVKLETVKENPIKCSWKNVRTEVPNTCIDPKFEKSILESFAKHELDLDNFVNVAGTPIISSLPSPIKIESENVDLSISLPGIIQQPMVLGDIIIGLPIASIIAPFQPFVAELDQVIDNELKKLNTDKLKLREILKKQKLLQIKHANILPSIENISSVADMIVKIRENGKYDEKHKSEQGLRILFGDAEKYISGQFLQTASGEIFVPGNVLETSSGPSFVPGFVLHTTEGTKFLPGYIFKDEEGLSTFIAGQTALTRDGEKFVQGQTLHTKDSVRFVPGQTVIAADGIKFIPGQIVEDSKNENGFRFVPGQTINMPEGSQFVPGQFLENSAGEITFFAGQSILNENCNWEFVQGQNMKTEDGSYVFVPGKEIINETGYKQFIPGRVVIQEGKTERFIPAVKNIGDNIELNFDLNESLTHIIEQPLHISENDVGFPISSTVITPTPIILQKDLIIDDILKKFNLDQSVLQNNLKKQKLLQMKYISQLPTSDSIFLIVNHITEIVKAGKCDDVYKFEQGMKITIQGEERYIFGQFFQTMSGEVFIPGNILETSAGPSFVPGFVIQTPTGSKFLPGRIFKNNDGSSIFVAGQTALTKTGEKFIQGQMMRTENGIQFITGQTVLVDNEMKFIPGHIFKDEKSENGCKFVLGRAVTKENGTHFIPGKFVENSVGDVSFIAGLSVLNENCNWEFVEGQTMENRNGNLFFVPGKEIIDEIGHHQFVPENFKREEGKMGKFMPVISGTDNNCYMDFDKKTDVVEQSSIEIQNTVGLPIASVVKPPQPFLPKVDLIMNDAIKELNANKPYLKELFKKQKFIQENFDGKLPSIEDISTIIKFTTEIMDLNKYDEKYKCECGMKIVVGKMEKCIPGQFLKTSAGEIFVPGKIVEKSEGLSFIPGFEINTSAGKKFLPGYIFKNENDSSVFVAGQMALTQNGEKFIQGQTLLTKDGVQFVQGQTILIDGDMKFVPGQIFEDSKSECGFQFVPGQTNSTKDGPQFIPGRFTETLDSETSFIAGISILNEKNNWEFVEGEHMKTINGNYTFIPGKQIVNEIGKSCFVPGSVYIEDAKIEQFVPGITINSENGNLKFVAGMEIETKDGLKFVEGMIVEHDKSLIFSAGKISQNEKDKIEFNKAKTKDEVLFHDIYSNFGICLNTITIAEAEGNEVFGHLVQSSQGVEFFPGESTGLPAGKVIPGRLVKGKETRFIPGTMVNNEFIPGQFVTYDKDEKFIPGQVIETNEGPKFVPGQVLHTKSGSKFVPGQTMETENGPKFIPGQIIETKSGPTFIPGQVIYTEEEGSRFVPGQVVDTIEGPRFVPGRVVETGDHVTFIPGQIVETEDGLKFVAPDLEDDPEGGYQFTVQGFEVPQEELNMIHHNSIPYTCFVGEMTIDLKTMQQLADAGMSVGRQIPVDVPVIDIKSLPVTETACRVASKLNIDPSYSIKMSHILSNLQQIKQSNVAVLEDKNMDANLKILLHLALECDDDKEGVEFLQTLGNALENTIKMDLEQKLQIINILHSQTTDIALKIRNKQPNKILLLKNLVKNNYELKEDVIQKLIFILNEDEKDVRVAFQHMSEENPDFVDKVLQNASEMLKGLNGDEKNAVDTLHRAIVKAVAETSEEKVHQVLEKTESEDFRSLVVGAIGLAKALGLSEVVMTLNDILNDSNSMPILAKDVIVMEVLKRLTIMRQLAVKRPNFGCALHDLQTDPYAARNDPRLKELVRESAMLMVIPEESFILRSSEDIPCSLLFSDNNLAVEDFMVKTGQCGKTFLILKKGMQAVIPREAARDVLTGKVPYTVLDENGIHYFTPLHVFNALKLPRFATNRFSNYGYSPRIPKSRRSSHSSSGSIGDVRKNLLNGSCSTQEGMEEEFTLVKDFIGDDDDFYLDKGERVKVLKTDDDDPTL